MKARFEWVVNILSLVLVVVIAVILIRQYYFPVRPNQIPESLKPNTTVSLAGVNWAAHENTLILALSVGCHWCEASASFYRALLRDDEPRSFYVVAVLPQPKDQADNYLSQVLKIKVDEVRSGEFRKLGILGTPTLILADSSGRIRSAWTGKLSEQNEAEVFSRLGMVRPASLSDASAVGEMLRPVEDAPSIVTPHQVLNLLRIKSAVPLVDVRPRAKYRQAHIEGFLNIPVDELEVRAPHEVLPRATVAVYCDRCDSCGANATEQRLNRLCSLSETHLTNAGFRVKFVDGDLLHLKRSGVPITGNPEADRPHSGPS